MDTVIFQGVDLIVTVLKAFRFYGISLYDAVLWSVYISITWFVVMFAFRALSGGSDD